MVVAATGFFDGVHKGHAKVLGKLCEIAKKEGSISKVITFWPHPRSVLQQDAHSLRLLTSKDEKRDLIKGLGVDEVDFIEFTKDFSKLSTENFIKEYLIDRFHVDSIVIGYDHKLGHNVNQTQKEMIGIAENLGLNVYRIDECLIGNIVVSSTKIRTLLSAGYLDAANDYLGYRYGVKGVVVSGNHLGRKIGFPTANMQLYDPLKIIPARGVYAVLVEVQGNTYKGMCNIGLRPTVTDDNQDNIETHIFDFNDDIYGLDIKLEFVKKIRDEQKFPSVEDLIEQLERDRNLIKNFFLDYSGPMVIR